MLLFVAGGSTFTYRENNLRDIYLARVIYYVHIYVGIIFITTVAVNFLNIQIPYNRMQAVSSYPLCDCSVPNETLG